MHFQPVFFCLLNSVMTVSAAAVLVFAAGAAAAMFMRVMIAGNIWIVVKLARKQSLYSIICAA